MKPFTLFLLIQLALAASPYREVLDYVLRAIEYEASEHYGAFSCVFYGVGVDNSYSFRMLNDMLKSPRLDHVVKYVVEGADYQSEWENLPMNPAMLVLHPGHDGAYLNRSEVYKVVCDVLKLFNPITNVLVLVDFSNERLFNEVQGVIGRVKFTYSVFLDCKMASFRQCNGKWCWDSSVFPSLPSLFNYGRRWMKGRPITYIRKEDKVPVDWNLRWTWEVARYLNTDVVHYPHKCKESDPNFTKCMDSYHCSVGRADISFNFLRVNIDRPRRFGQLYTTIPMFIKVAIPKDRPLNTVEIILMPFAVPVWALLGAILVCSQLAKQLFPNRFKNDPILLVVCGFERHNLHQAGRWEKATLLPLIVLMFFLSSAFETKITSLMVSRPSIQRIKTLDDFFRSDLKLYADLENHPILADDPIFGKKVTQGYHPAIGEVIPNAAMLWTSEWVETFHDLFYDFERMQPAYFTLDGDIPSGYELYATSTRFLFLEDFRLFHIWLVEAGLIKRWKRQYSDEIRAVAIGRMNRVDIGEKVDLTFEDMQIAWVVLTSGLGVAMAGFLVEWLKHLFDLKRKIVVEKCHKLWKILKLVAASVLNYISRKWRLNQVLRRLTHSKKSAVNITRNL